MIKNRLVKILKRLSDNRFQTLNRIEISRDNLLSNFNYFKSLNPKIGVIPVLKSNAYGHGIKQVAEILNSAECDLIAVDGYFEAVKIREITKHRILVLGYIKSDNYSKVDTKKCSFVVQDTSSLAALALLGKKVNIHVELNTGMNRLGLRADELDEYLIVLKKYPKLHLEGIMSHLADADNDNESFTKKQVKLFDSLVKTIFDAGFSPKYIHIAQTAGSVVAKSDFANSIRLGIGIYGISPLEKRNKNMRYFENLKPVMELKSTIIKIIDLKVGDRVSYNGIFTADKAMRIGILPLGYYEGVPRELSNRGVVTVPGYELPIIGRVCMNHTMIDLVNSKLSVGDEVTIVSSDSTQVNSIEKICDKFGLFSYQIISNITENIRRVTV